MEDSQIVQLYWDRDEQAIPHTAEKYGGYCLAVAGNILGNSKDAEECVNDTYLNAWNAIPPHRPQVLSAFLGKITRNLAFNRHKRNTADKRGGGEAAAVLEELAEVVSGKDNVEQEVDRRALVNEIDVFLGKLPAEKRKIFLCRYWYFDSIADIASRFGKSENGVPVLLHRLREKLRRHLTERGFAI